MKLKKFNEINTRPWPLRVKGDDDVVQTNKEKQEKEKLSDEEMVEEFKKRGITYIPAKPKKEKQITIKSNPQGATVYINTHTPIRKINTSERENKGVTPLTLILPFGHYDIKLTRPDYKDYYGFFHIDSTSKNIINFSLTKRNSTYYPPYEPGNVPVAKEPDKKDKSIEIPKPYDDDKTSWDLSRYNRSEPVKVDPKKAEDLLQIKIKLEEIQKRVTSEVTQITIFQSTDPLSVMFQYIADYPGYREDYTKNGHFEVVKITVMADNINLKWITVIDNCQTHYTPNSLNLVKVEYVTKFLHDRYVKMNWCKWLDDKPVLGGGMGYI